MDAEGLLLKEELFGEMMEVSWPRFCNTLQRFFLHSTRQDPEAPARPLSLKDFEVFAARLHVPGTAATTVTAESWGAFWDWFGAGVEKWRHQRAIAPMACAHMFAGFLPRAEAERWLAGQSNGSFVIRFSERFNGRFAVAFVRNGRVVHTLVNESDGSGAKRGVLEFLTNVADVRQLLVVPMNWFGRETAQRSFVSKEEVLRLFLSPRKPRPPVTPISGYEDVTSLDSPAVSPQPSDMETDS